MFAPAKLCCDCRVGGFGRREHGLPDQALGGRAAGLGSRDVLEAAVQPARGAGSGLSISASDLLVAAAGGGSVGGGGSAGRGERGRWWLVRAAAADRRGLSASAWSVSKSATHGTPHSLSPRQASPAIHSGSGCTSMKSVPNAASAAATTACGSAVGFLKPTTRRLWSRVVLEQRRVDCWCAAAAGGGTGARAGGEQNGGAASY